MIAAIIGLGVYLIVYGPAHLLGTSHYWSMPSTDERMYLIGYRYYLIEPWHWPLFTSHNVDAPYLKSVAFLDCIPLWALINKSLAEVVPGWGTFSSHAYLGLWHGLAYALQACFGVACLRKLGHRSWRDGIIASLFFLALPWWIFRYGHAALSANWLELWAFYLYLRTPVGKDPPRNLNLAKICQLAIASLVAPYHTVMSYGFFGASIVRGRRTKNGLIVFAIAIATTALSLWLAGYFSRETRGRQWGFESESANMLGWLVPVRSGLIGNGSWIANVLATDGQWEGYAYLGIGYLMLLVLLLRHPTTLLAVVRRHAGLFLVAVAFGLLSLSNHIYFGSHEILSYPFPHFLHRIPDQFRSPGRFVWIPLYVLIVYLLHWSFTRFSQGRRYFILVLIAAVQVIDASGDWRLQHGWANGPNQWPSLLQQDGWRRLISRHDAVVVEPTFNCIQEPAVPELYLISTEIEFLVSEKALPINGTYTTRPSRRCATEELDWPTMPSRAGTLFVFLPRANAIAQRFFAAGTPCASFSYGALCTSDRGALAEAVAAGIARPFAQPQNVQLDEKVELGSLVGMTADWSAPDRGGRWVTDAQAGLLFHIDNTTSRSLTLHVQGAAFLCGTRENEDVDIWVDGTHAGALHFDRKSNSADAVRTISIPSAMDGSNGLIAVSFVPRETKDWATLGCGDDLARRGFWLRSIWFSAD